MQTDRISSEIKGDKYIFEVVRNVFEVTNIGVLYENRANVLTPFAGPGAYRDDDEQRNDDDGVHGVPFLTVASDYLIWPLSNNIWSLSTLLRCADCSTRPTFERLNSFLPETCRCFKLAPVFTRRPKPPVWTTGRRLLILKPNAVLD